MFVCLSQDPHVDSLFRHLHTSDGSSSSEKETSNLLKVMFPPVMSRNVVFYLSSSIHIWGVVGPPYRLYID